MLRFICIRIIFLMGILLVACTQEKNHHAADFEYSISRSETIRLEDVFSEVSLIPLEFAGDYYPHGIAEVQCRAGLFGILDNRKSLHIFSYDGHFIDCSDRMRGQGPGEISVIMGFSINPSDTTVQILTPKEFVKYDTCFRKIMSADLPTQVGQDCFMFSYLSDLSASRHLLLPSGVSTYPDRLFTCNSLSQEISELFSFGDEIIVNSSMQTSCMHIDADSTILFIPPAFTGHIYALSPDLSEISRHIALNLSDDFITKADLQISDDSKDPDIFSFNKDIPLRIDISAGKIFLLSSSQPGLNGMRYYIIDRDTGTSGHIKLMENSTRIFPLIADTDSQYAYAVMEKEKLEESPALLITQQNMNLLANFEPETLIMLKYRLK